MFLSLKKFCGSMLVAPSNFKQYILEKSSTTKGAGLQQDSVLVQGPKSQGKSILELGKSCFLALLSSQRKAFVLLCPIHQTTCPPRLG
jgi:hypothetical protein